MAITDDPDIQWRIRKFAHGFGDSIQYPTGGVTKRPSTHKRKEYFIVPGFFIIDQTAVKRGFISGIQDEPGESFPFLRFYDGIGDGQGGTISL